MDTFDSCKAPIIQRRPRLRQSHPLRFRRDGRFVSLAEMRGIPFVRSFAASLKRIGRQFVPFSEMTCRISQLWTDGLNMPANQPSVRPIPDAFPTTDTSRASRSLLPLLFSAAVLTGCHSPSHFVLENGTAKWRRGRRERGRYILYRIPHTYRYVQKVEG